MSSSAGVVKYRMEHSLEGIYSATIKFLMPIDLPETYKRITEEGKNLIDAKFATIFLANKGRLTRKYTSGPKSYRLVLRKKGYTYTAFESGKVAIISIEDYRRAHPDAPVSKIKTIFNIPLTNHGKTVGVLNLHSENKYKNRKQTLKSLQLYGSLASMAIRKAQLYDEAKEALNARDLFISMAAHELRTPLTTINGYAQLFNQKLANNEMPKKSWAQTLQFETLRLRRLINELLQVDQIKTEKFLYSFEYLSVNDVLKQAIRDVRFRYPKTKFILNPKKIPSDIINGDYDKLLQVFINVLNNGAKFSGENGEVSILVNTSKNYLTVYIEDFGKGISLKDQKHVFEEFYKGENTVGDGFGIGLFISKKIIDEHSGKIKIKSKLNIGTIVEIKLPKTKI